MKVYQVLNQAGKGKETYHESENAAMLYFLMGGKKGAYLGSAYDDWDGFKKAGWTMQEYDLEETKKERTCPNHDVPLKYYIETGLHVCPECGHCE